MNNSNVSIASNRNKVLIIACCESLAPVAVSDWNPNNSTFKIGSSDCYNMSFKRIVSFLVSSEILYELVQETR